jgi:hypothetical protein
MFDGEDSFSTFGVDVADLRPVCETEAEMVRLGVAVSSGDDFVEGGFGDVGDAVVAAPEADEEPSAVDVEAEGVSNSTGLRFGVACTLVINLAREA